MSDAELPVALSEYDRIVAFLKYAYSDSPLPPANWRNGVSRRIATAWKCISSGAGSWPCARGLPLRLSAAV